MSPKKRVPKKAKKAAGAKKPARGKKLAAKKKPAPKKKPAIKKKAGRKLGPAAVTSTAHAHSENRAAPATGGLGEWSEDTGVDEAVLLEDDELAPDYGGSK